MPIQCQDRFRSWVITRFLAVVVLAAIHVQPATAQTNPATAKPNNASIWGPMFRSQVARCWGKPVPVGDEAANMKAVFEIKLARGGMLDGQPVLQPDSSPTTSDYAQAYQKSALNAVTGCQPYRLPAEYYDEWKHFAPIFQEMPPPKGQEPPPLKGKEKPVADVFNSRTLSICRGC